MQSQISETIIKSSMVGKTVVSYLAAALLFGMSPLGQAHAGTPNDMKKQADDWQFIVGAAGGYFADYEGSDDYDFTPLPLIGVSWRDTVSIGSVDGPPGLKVKFLKIKGPRPKDRLVLSTSLGYFGGRDQDDNDALQGLGDLDGGVTIRFSADYQIQDFGAGLSVGRDLSGDREGTTVNMGLKYSFALGSPKTQLTLGASTTWADDSYMESIFSISTAQAASSTLGYAAFNSEAGFKDVGLDVSVRHFWSQNVMVMGKLGHKQLLSDAADSPIVDDQGNAAQFSALIGVIYVW